MKIIPNTSPYFTYETAIKHIEMLFGDLLTSFDDKCLTEIKFRNDNTCLCLYHSIKLEMKDGKKLYWPIYPYEKEISINEGLELLKRKINA